MKSNKSGRKSPRAQWHDYNGAEYFVTICTKNMVHYFGEVVDKEIQLTKVGEYTEKCINKIHEINTDVHIPLYVIMPNHIHLIIIFDTHVGLSYHGSQKQNVGLSYLGSQKQNVDLGYHNVTSLQDEFNIDNKKDVEMMRRANRCGKLSYIIGQFKSAVTKYANQNNISFAWQTRYHDRIIRNQKAMNQIAEYIKNNPIVWK